MREWDDVGSRCTVITFCPRDSDLALIFFGDVVIRNGRRISPCEVVVCEDYVIAQLPNCHLFFCIGVAEYSYSVPLDGVWLGPRAGVFSNRN